MPRDDFGMALTSLIKRLDPDVEWDFHNPDHRSAVHSALAEAGVAYADLGDSVIADLEDAWQLWRKALHEGEVARWVMEGALR